MDALARERRKGLGDGSATQPSQVVHKLLRLANLHVEVVAVAAHCFNQTRWSRSFPWSVPAPGQELVLADVRSKAIQLAVVTRLLKRMSEIDMEHCPNCGGDLNIIAAILEQPVIEKMLTHLRLQARAPRRLPDRGQAQQAA